MTHKIHRPATDLDLGGRAPLELIAYSVGQRAPMPIVPAPAARQWMDATDEHFANRCLPLLVANQAGWFILNSHSFRAVWNGDNAHAGLAIMYLDGEPPYPASSMFGYGILTFSIPFLFRTPPGYNLLARGPANCPKDGIAPLEGVVETDWAVATFTMNWQLTRPDHVVEFAQGEPICMIVPQRRGELEEFRPQFQDIRVEPELEYHHRQWAESRYQFKIRLNMMWQHRIRGLWQKHYFHGTSPTGVQAPAHQLKLKLRSFESGGNTPGRS